MILDHFSYIKTEACSGDIRADIKNLLFSNGKYNTYVHVSNVAERNALIAKTYNLDHDKCVIAGLLHDIRKCLPITYTSLLQNLQILSCLL